MGLFAVLFVINLSDSIIFCTQNVCRHATTRLRMYVIVKYFGVECICVGIFGLIFYWRCVVVGVVNCTGVIYGVRTSLFLTSQRMPSRYNAFANVCNCKIFRRGMYLHWYFLFYNTHTNNSTQNHNSQFKIKHPYFTSIISF